MEFFLESTTETGHACGEPYSFLSSLEVRVSPKHVLYGVLAISGLVTILVREYRRRRHRHVSSYPSAPATPALEKGKSPSKFSQPYRVPGTWIPSSFTFPTPPAYPDWSVTNTKPLPYRPFRYGPKEFITMGMRNEKHENWIELDNHYPRYHADKVRRIAERGSKCSRTAPEALPAAHEFLEELVKYLCARYPSLYRRTPTGIENLWSGETFNIVERPLQEDPMQMAARLVQDDLAIMIEKPDGQYYLLAASILLAGFWRLEDKFGMPLSEVHTSGHVPSFKEKLEKGMMNLFRRLKPEEMVARSNYFIQRDDNLAWSATIGSEDDRGVGWDTAETQRLIDEHHFRSERQTLWRLPKTGGIVFTIRTYFHPLADIVEEDYVPGRLASAIRSWGDDVSRYKGKAKFEHQVLEYLDQKHRDQVERGLDLERENEVRAYPY